MTTTFTAQLGDAIDMEIEDLEYVMRQSITDVVTGAQDTQIGITQGATSFEEGKIPVGLTAELVNSFTVDGAGSADVTVQIAGMEIGDSMDFAWSAPHARAIEDGWTTSKGTNVPGRHFVGKNAAEFPDHVERRAAEVRR